MAARGDGQRGELVHAMHDKAERVGGIVGGDPLPGLSLEDGVERPADLLANQRRAAPMPAPPLAAACATAIGVPAAAIRPTPRASA
jgi:hypothetical protein